MANIAVTPRRALLFSNMSSIGEEADLNSFVSTPNVTKKVVLSFPSTAKVGVGGDTGESLLRIVFDDPFGTSAFTSLNVLKSAQMNKALWVDVVLGLAETLPQLLSGSSEQATRELVQECNTCFIPPPGKATWNACTIAMLTTFLHQDTVTSFLDLVRTSWPGAVLLDEGENSSPVKPVASTNGTLCPVNVVGTCAVTATAGHTQCISHGPLTKCACGGWLWSKQKFCGKCTQLTTYGRLQEELEQSRSEMANLRRRQQQGTRKRKDRAAGESGGGLSLTDESSGDDEDEDDDADRGTKKPHKFVLDPTKYTPAMIARLGVYGQKQLQGIQNFAKVNTLSVDEFYPYVPLDRAVWEERETSGAMDVATDANGALLVKRNTKSQKALAPEITSGAMAITALNGWFLCYGIIHPTQELNIVNLTNYFFHDFAPEQEKAGNRDWWRRVLVWVDWLRRISEHDRIPINWVLTTSRNQQKWLDLGMQSLTSKAVVPLAMNNTTMKKTTAGGTPSLSSGSQDQEAVAARKAARAEKLGKMDCYSIAAKRPCTNTTCPYKHAAV